jgi:hypothetical protein
VRASAGAGGFVLDGRAACQAGGVMADQLYTCPECGAQFSTAHTQEWTHCALCGTHGKHECVGAVDREARRARARAHLELLKAEWDVAAAKKRKPQHIPYEWKDH